MTDIIKRILAAHPAPHDYKIAHSSFQQRRPRSELTQARLQELLHYDPETGEFTWLVHRTRVGAGQLAGTVKDGYIAIGVDGTRYQAHRLAFLYMTGSIPDGYIDHINLNGFDNRWANLRAATNSQNQANTSIRVNNTSGFKGVSWNKREKRWRADIRVNGKKITLGLFRTPKEAGEVYRRAANQHHGEFARSA